MNELRQLALLISAFLAILCSSLPVGSSKIELPPPLTPTNFRPTIERGIWCIEFFSPHCGHCRRFMPTWTELVEQNKRGEHSNWAQGHQGARLAQVDCAMNGDLCNEMKIDGWPTLVVYRDGVEEERFKGDRTLDRLSTWLKKWWNEGDSVDSKKLEEHPTSTGAVETRPNRNGEVLKLTSSSFQTFLSGSTSPIFVKFFAPWCGHCKKLAPTWTSLAKHLQNRLTIAEVNCDDEKALCTSQGVTGYPSLMFYSPGGESKSEYTGSRKIEKLVEWAHKATAEPTEVIQASDLEKHLKEESVVYVLLHESDSVLSHLKPLFTGLLGPRVYTILSPPLSLFSQYALPSQARTSPFSLLAFKDNVTQPTAIYVHPYDTSHSSMPVMPPLSKDERDEIHHWLAANRLPGSLELSQETWQGVMNAPQAPLVVLAATHSDAEKRIVSERLAELATMWRLKTSGTGKVLWKSGGWSPKSFIKGKGKDADGVTEKDNLNLYGREVIFASMDRERWKDWLKSMYGIQGVHSDKDALDYIPVVVVDHSALTYYPMAPSSSASQSFNAVNDDYSNLVSINLASSANVFAAIEGAAAGKLRKHYSENIFERMIRHLSGMLISVEEGVVSHPFRTLFLLFGVVVLVITVLRRLLREDTSYAGSRREWEKDKGRMD